MLLYSIANWNTLYENNRTRELKQLTWVPVPNNHDGDGYTLLVDRSEGAALFGGWIACVQVASKCDPRGTLLRRGGKPHDPDSLSRITRIPKTVFQKLLVIAVEELHWLIVKQVTEAPQDGAVIPQADATIPQEGALNGREGNGMEGTTNMSGRAEEKRVLTILNECCGRQYREIESNLAVIRQRLDEPGVTVDGVESMIRRQCQKWKGTKMEEYLRPETLFRKSKFDSYYAAKDLPVVADEEQTTSPAMQAVLHRDELKRIETKLEDIVRQGSRVAGGDIVFTQSQKDARRDLLDRKVELLKLLGFKA